MSMINDGGPAFPLPVEDLLCHSRFESGYGGMTLRDYFAAKAMAALIAEPLNEGESGTAWSWAKQSQMHTQMSGPDIFAHAAYRVADAMLKEREERELTAPKSDTVEELVEKVLDRMRQAPVQLWMSDLIGEQISVKRMREILTFAISEAMKK